MSPDGTGTFPVGPDQISVGKRLRPLIDRDSSSAKRTHGGLLRIPTGGVLEDLYKREAGTGSLVAEAFFAYALILTPVGVEGWVGWGGGAGGFTCPFGIVGGARF